MKKNEIEMFSEHPNFNFNEAKNITLAYILSDEILSIDQLADRLSISGKQIQRYFKVCIIFSLISEENIDKLIAKKASFLKKGQGFQIYSICMLENCVELADERKKLIRKLKFYKECFGDKKNFGDLNEKYVNKIIEIERSAFM